MTKTTIKQLFTLFPDAGSDLRSAPRIGLQRLLGLRVLAAITGVSGALLFNVFSPLTLPLFPVALVLAGVLVSVSAGYWRVKYASVISHGELIIQLSLDFVFATVLLAYTDGASNPLISYLLVLLAVGATLLRSLWAHLFALLAITIHTVFLIVAIVTEEHSQHMPNFQLHLVGMWVTFVVSAALITTFVSRMASAIRSRELTLAKSRENEMRNEQLVAIGSLAAGTAHALGTPLSTMAVLLSELDSLDEQQLRDASIKADIHLLREQVVRCKHSLDQLTKFYHHSDQQQQGCMRIAAFHEAIRDYVVNIHPTANIEFDIEPDSKELWIPADITIRHALINIIENAIRAAHSVVKVSYSLDPEKSGMALIRVQDDGDGIPAEVMESMGEPFISSREGSMGLGIFLANSTLQRHGGSIEMFNLMQSGGQKPGAQTLIHLPLVTQQAKGSRYEQ
jgi:two-component system, sensor histidine kinase RegB